MFLKKRKFSHELTVKRVGHKMQTKSWSENRGSVGVMV